jgi:hypothetical protein
MTTPSIMDLLKGLKENPEAIGKIVNSDPTWCAGQRVKAHGREWITLVQISKVLYLAVDATEIYPADVRLIKVEERA